MIGVELIVESLPTFILKKQKWDSKALSMLLISCVLAICSTWERVWNWSMLNKVWIPTLSFEIN